MGRSIQVDQMLRQPQVLIQPFEKWALYFVGQIAYVSRQKRYILVCIDFVTKWVEAKPLLYANEKDVVYFLFEDIFTCFGVPREIGVDQGTQITSKLVQTIIE